MDLNVLQSLPVPKTYLLRFLPLQDNPFCFHNLVLLQSQLPRLTSKQPRSSLFLTLIFLPDTNPRPRNYRQRLFDSPPGRGHRPPSGNDWAEQTASVRLLRSFLDCFKVLISGAEERCSYSQNLSSTYPSPPKREAACKHIQPRNSRI